MAAANRPIFGPDRDIEDHVCCILEFPMPDYDEDDPKTHRKKISVQYASINGNGYLGYGELVYGTKGTLALEKEQELKLLTGSGDEGEGETTVKVTGGGGGPSLGHPVQRPGPQGAPAEAGPRSAAAMPRSWSIGPGASAIPRRRTSPAAIPAWPWPTRSSP